MKTAISRIGLVLAAAAPWTAVLPAPPALAGEEAKDRCQQLWVDRNMFYKNAGYCFKTVRAQQYFGSGGCSFHDISAVPLSAEDHRRINEIKTEEARIGCSSMAGR